jgi:hypothetical protein
LSLINSSGRGRGSPHASIRQSAAKALLSVGTCIGSETVLMRSTIGEYLVVGIAITGLLCVLFIAVTIARGSEQACERIFRLLRWIRNCPEPPSKS